MKVPCSCTGSRIYTFTRISSPHAYLESLISFLHASFVACSFQQQYFRNIFFLLAHQLPVVCQGSVLAGQDIFTPFVVCTCSRLLFQTESHPGDVQCTAFQVHGFRTSCDFVALGFLLCSSLCLCGIFLLCDSSLDHCQVDWLFLLFLSASLLGIAAASQNGRFEGDWSTLIEQQLDALKVFANAMLFSDLWL